MVNLYIPLSIIYLYYLYLNSYSISNFLFLWYVLDYISTILLKIIGFLWKVVFQEPGHFQNVKLTDL